MTTSELSNAKKVINNLKYWHDSDLEMLFQGIINSKLQVPYSMGEGEQLSKLKTLITSTLDE